MLLYILLTLVLPLFGEAYYTEYAYIGPEYRSYAIGDTIYAEGTIVSSNTKQIQPYSRYVYIELVNSSDSVLIRQKVACHANGSFRAAVPSEYQWPADLYYLRAYTRLMQNFNPENIPLTPLMIGKDWQDRNEKVENISCHFYPEGGHWLEDKLQSMAVELKDDQGWPVSGEALLLNGSNDTILRIQFYPFGLGLLRFHPIANETYRLAVDAGDYAQTFTLPPTKSGCSLQVTSNRQRITYQTINIGTSLSRHKLFLYDPEKGLEEIPFSDEQTAGIIDCNEGGLFTLFLVGPDAEIKAERSVWIDPMQTTNSIMLNLSKDNYYPGEPVVYSIDRLLPEDQVFVRIESISNPLIKQAFGCLCFQGELSSPVSFPVLTESGKDKQELAIWLMTAHFSRFNIRRILRDGFHYKYPFEDKIFFSGNVSRKKRKPLTSGMLLAYHTSTNHVYEADIDPKGNFTMAVDDFNEGETFFLQACNAKNKMDFYEYTLNDETFPIVVNRNKLRQSDRNNQLSLQVIAGDSIRRLDKEGMNYILPEFVVKAKIKKEDPKSTEKFYGVNYKDQKTIDKRDYPTLLEILRDMPGIRVGLSSNDLEKTEDGGQTERWVIYSTRGSSLLKDKELTVLLDGARADLEQVINMSGKEIASVELLKPWQTNSYISGAVSGAILIKSRDSMGSLDEVSKGVYYAPLGLASTVYNADAPLLAPKQPGEYYLLIDIVTANRSIQSFRRRISVSGVPGY